VSHEAIIAKSLGGEVNELKRGKMHDKKTSGSLDAPIKLKLPTFKRSKAYERYKEVVFARELVRLLVNDNTNLHKGD